MSEDILGIKFEGKDIIGNYWVEGKNVAKYFVTHRIAPTSGIIQSPHCQ